MLLNFTVLVMARLSRVTQSMKKWHKGNIRHNVRRLNESYMAQVAHPHFKFTYGDIPRDIACKVTFFHRNRWNNFMATFSGPYSAVE